jgi:hypothetical protein
VDWLPGDRVDDHLQLSIISHVGDRRSACIARELLCKHAIRSGCVAHRGARKANTEVLQELTSRAAEDLLFAHDLLFLRGGARS